jgi:hypothetical protein
VVNLPRGTHPQPETVLERVDVSLVLELLLVQELELAAVVVVRPKTVRLADRHLEHGQNSQRRTVSKTCDVGRTRYCSTETCSSISAASLMA